MAERSFWSSRIESAPRVRKHRWLTILLGVVGAGLLVLYTVGSYEDSLWGALFVTWIPLWMTWWHGWRWGLAYLVLVLGVVVAKMLNARQMVGWIFVGVVLAGLVGSIIAFVRTPSDQR